MNRGKRQDKDGINTSVSCRRSLKNFTKELSKKFTKGKKVGGLERKVIKLT
jgi:hypothetical protein